MKILIIFLFSIAYSQIFKLLNVDTKVLEAYELHGEGKTCTMRRFKIDDRGEKVFSKDETVINNVVVRERNALSKYSNGYPELEYTVHVQGNGFASKKFYGAEEQVLVFLELLNAKNGNFTDQLSSMQDLLSAKQTEKVKKMEARIQGGRRFRKKH
jgi:hypothetical protein